MRRLAPREMTVLRFITGIRHGSACSGVMNARIHSARSLEAQEPAGIDS